MNTPGYGKFIDNLIKQWPIEKPILTSNMAERMADAFRIDLTDAKKITNVNLKRIADRGALRRIQKGVYGKIAETPFGMLAPTDEELLPELLLWEDGKAIGYDAGPSLLNMIGLCTLMPKYRTIATNQYRRKIPARAPINVRKPITTVTQENAPYLRALEAISVMDDYPVDAENPEDMLRGMFRRNGLSNERLIWYARRHCDNQMLVRTIDIALGGDQSQ